MPSQNAPITEADSLQQFLANSQSTHNSVASSSVGMALLHLKKIYFASNTVNIPEKYAHCLKQMKLAAKNDSEKLKAIQFLDNQSNRIDRFDTISLYLKNNNKYESVETVFPLKEVIMLVWLALNDHEKYMHNYAGSNQAQFATARGEYNLRLESFFICITSMPNDLCHTGIRNDLVFLLNKSYLGIDIIEDARSTVYMIIKEHTNKLFWEHFQAAATTYQKKILTKSLMIWITHDNPVPLLDSVDKNKVLNKSLETLFIKHGSDPAYIKLDELIINCLPNVKFNYDPEQYPIIKTIEKIVISAVGEADETILLALKNFKQWLIDCFELQDNIQHEKIMAFYHIYHAYKNIDDHNNMLLTTTGNMEADFHDLSEKCKSYLAVLAHKDLRQEFPLPTDNLAEIAKRFGVQLANCKANTMYEQIVNFFVKWNFERLHANVSNHSTLYHLFLDEEVFQSKVILKDEDIDTFLNITDHNNPYRDITVYQINRIFLHAIIVSVSDWSDKFGFLFLEVLNFVKNNFNDHSDASLIVNNLRRDSYKDDLINQLNYYADCFTCIKNKTSSTLDEGNSVLYLFLPQHVKTMTQWASIYVFMSAKKRLEIYKRYEIKINQIIFLYMSQKGLEHYCVWLFHYIPAEYQVKFIKQPKVLDLIVKSQSIQAFLYGIMQRLSPEKLASVFHAIAGVLKFKCERNFIEVYKDFIDKAKINYPDKSLMLLYVFSIVDETTVFEKLWSDQKYWSETFLELPPAKRLAFLKITENNQFTQPSFIKIIKSHLSENDYYRFLTQILSQQQANSLLDYDVVPRDDVFTVGDVFSGLSFTNLSGFINYINRSWDAFIKIISILDNKDILPFIKDHMQKSEENKLFVSFGIKAHGKDYMSIFKDLPKTDKTEFLQIFYFVKCDPNYFYWENMKEKERFIYMVEFMLDKNDEDLTRQLNQYVYTFVNTYSALRAAQTSFFKSADWAKENNILDLPPHEALALIFRHAHESPHSRTNAVLSILDKTYGDNTHVNNLHMRSKIYIEGFKRSGIFKKSGKNTLNIHTLQRDENPKTRRGKIFKIMYDRDGEGLKEHLAKKERERANQNQSAVNAPGLQRRNSP